MTEKERGRSSGEHLRKGIGYFQSGDLEEAIKMWEAAFELDPGNKNAAEYEIRAEEGAQAPVTPPPS